MGKIIKINLHTKLKETKSGRKFRTYFTKMKLMDGLHDSKELIESWVNVRFTKDVNTIELTRNGLLECLAINVNVPYNNKPYKDKDGKLVYPTIWIKKYETFTPKNNVNQNSFLDVEEDTEETEF